MGLGKRILDAARSNLNGLMERALRDELGGVTEVQLQAELLRRQRDRSMQESERQQRLAAEAAARSRGSARKKEESRRPRAVNAAGQARMRQARVQALYEVLGVRVGAPFEEVKRAYRGLMRQHHPDRHAGSALEERAAGERTAQISAAYAELEAVFASKPETR